MLKTIKFCIIILMSISPILWVTFDGDIMALSFYKLKTESSTNFELKINYLVVVNVLTLLVLLLFKLHINSEYTRKLHILMDQESVMQSKKFIMLASDLIRTIDDV